MKSQNRFENRSSSTKGNQVRFILRRERDRTRFILFYCVFGFLLIFGQSVRAAEVCAASFTEMKTSPSEKLRGIGMQMQSKLGFTNQSNSSHIKFKNPEGPNGRVIVTFYSTQSDGEFEFKEGALTVCDDDGTISINSAPTGKLKVIFTTDCFKIDSLLANLQPTRSTFCLGNIPSVVQQAMDVKMSKERALAANSSDSAPILNDPNGVHTPTTARPAPRGVTR